MTRALLNQLNERVLKIIGKTTAEMYSKMKSEEYAEGFINEIDSVLEKENKYNKDAYYYTLFIYSNILLTFKNCLNLKPETVKLLESKKSKSKSKMKNSELLLIIEITDL